MNNVVWDKMKDLTPIRNARKYREDGDFLIVMSYSHEIKYFNDVAKSFYVLADGSRRLCEIINEMLEEYEVDESTLILDCIELVRNLQWEDMILLKGEV